MLMILRKLVVPVGALTIALSIMFSLAFLVPYQIVRHDMHATVSDQGISFKLDTDALWFGAIMPGDSGTREVSISSQKDSRIVITAGGELAPWVSVSSNEFTLATGKNKTVEVHAKIPENAESREYNGTLSFYFYRTMECGSCASSLK